MKIRGFLLFGFAFASVLSCSEALTSSRSISSKIMQPVSTDIPSTVLKELQPQAVEHDLRKRSIEIYQQSVYPKPNGNSEIENAFENENKRGSRFRFNGMRGKKDVGNKYFESYSSAEVEKPESPVYKRSQEELYEEKRIPFSFPGMKGNKFEDFDIKKLKSDSSDLNSPSTIQRYLISGGLPDDINSPDLDYLENILTKQGKEEWDNNASNEKSPNSFQGLKGKSSLYDLKKDLGFMDMKSKKSAGIWSRYFGYKRVPQSSFYGVKGKKVKSRFFGMRGKKSDEASAFPKLRSTNYKCSAGHEEVFGDIEEFYLNNEKKSQKKFFNFTGFNEPSSYQFQYSGLFDKIAGEFPRNRFRRQVWSSNSRKKNHFYGLRGRRSTDKRLASIQNF